MKTTSWIWLLVPIFMVPIAYGQETVLVANFMNGNNAALNSRIYLWNSSNAAGDVTVRVFTLPLRSGFPQELTSTPLSLGALGSKSALNLKLAEDILTPIGLFLPYTDNGGNLTLEFTIGAENVRGVAQVFSSDLAFGTYPLLETSSKIIGSAQLADQIDFGATGSRGLVRMLNSTGTVVTEVGATNDDRGVLALNDSTGNPVVVLGATATSGDGALFLLDTGFNVIAALSNSVDLGGSVQTFSPSGVGLAQMGPSTSGHGFIQTQNAIGNTIVLITSPLFGTGGFISVRNSSGTQTAGIDGSTGTVFGTTKSFIVDDPTDSSRKIKYTSLEGPEAAIYVRGTADLVSGRAYIEFPEHFAAMAAPSSITVSLTPRSASSLGLAAVDVSSQGIRVAELARGSNSYAFDYVAHAVRKGYEDYEVYLTKEQANELTGQASGMLQAIKLPKLAAE